VTTAASEGALRNASISGAWIDTSHEAAGDYTA
jgi:hypothetical protein